MKKNNITELIEEEKEKLTKLENRQVEIEKKIKACRANIEKYTLMKNSQQYSELANALDGKGISIEDILSAVSTGNLVALQNKIDETEKTTENKEE